MFAVEKESKDPRIGIAEGVIEAVPHLLLGAASSSRGAGAMLLSRALL